MKVSIQKYQESWPAEFARIRKEISTALHGLNAVIEHIGSTSVPGLAAKPVIDIMVGLPNAQLLDQTIAPMLELPYIYYPVYEDQMPDRRLFVRLKEGLNVKDFPKQFTEKESIPHEWMNQSRISNVHIWPINTEDWNRHIAFRDYLRTHPGIRDEYGSLKQKLSLQDWQNVNHYNGGKDAFIKRVEQLALQWWENRD